MADARTAANPAPAGLTHLGIGALGVGNLFDTMEYVRNAWSSLNVPSSLAPTVDVDELDRRIGDLKAVEQWLTINLNLLKASVQALEIQRGTIATLRAYGSMLESQAQAAAAPAAEPAAAASEKAAPEAAAMVPGLDTTAWWELLQRQFDQITAAALGAHGPGEKATSGQTSDARTATAREGAPVAGSRKTGSGAKTRKSPASDHPKPARAGSRPVR